MLWFYESFFPVVWIAFIVYWRIEAIGTKTNQRREPDAAGIVRALTFLIVIVLLSIPRIPLSWLYRQLWPLGLWPFWDWSCDYRRGPLVRRVGAPSPCQQLEQLRHHQAGTRADYHRALCRGPSSHLHRHSDRVSWHRDCALPGARGHRSGPDLHCALGQAAQGGGVDALPIWRDVCHLCPSDLRLGAVPVLIG